MKAGNARSSIYETDWITKLQFLPRSEGEREEPHATLRWAIKFGEGTPPE